MVSWKSFSFRDYRGIEKQITKSKIFFRIFLSFPPLNAIYQAMDLEVNQFVTQHALVSPILIISYDLYRIYSEALNTVSTLQVLLCDEGHKYLKNLLTTKTGLLLNNSIACRRMLFTGTIIQNNLKELFSMVSFVLPNYFHKFYVNYSSCQDSSEDDPYLMFKKEFVDFIVNSHSHSHSQSRKQEKESQLKEILSKIILKRNKDLILSAILPKKRVFNVFFPMNEEESRHYEKVSDSVLNSTTDTKNVLGKLSELRLFLSTGIIQVLSNQKDNTNKTLAAGEEKKDPLFWQKSRKLQVSEKHCYSPNYFLVF
jgi:SNF2 family DNA or RNA helicase